VGSCAGVGAGGGEGVGGGAMLTKPPNGCGETSGYPTNERRRHKDNIQGQRQPCRLIHTVYCDAHRITICVIHCLA
jgi:hypothetical protein